MTHKSVYEYVFYIYENYYTRLLLINLYDVIIYYYNNIIIRIQYK